MRSGASLSLPRRASLAAWRSCSTSSYRSEPPLSATTWPSNEPRKRTSSRSRVNPSSPSGTRRSLVTPRCSSDPPTLSVLVGNARGVTAPQQAARLCGVGAEAVVQDIQAERHDRRREAARGQQPGQPLRKLGDDRRVVREQSSLHELEDVVEVLAGAFTLGGGVGSEL